MKKLFFVALFIVAGFTIVFSSENKGMREEYPFNRIAKTDKVTEVKHDVMAPVTNISDETDTAPSLERLEENYQDLEVKDLQAALERVDKSRKKLQLIEAFNSRKLTELESKELTFIIRNRIVLTKLVMEKKFEELENL